MTAWRIEVFIPSLPSRGPTFDREGGELYVTTEDIERLLAARSQWPVGATLDPEVIPLRMVDAIGYTYRNRTEHEVVNGQRIGFTLRAPMLPPSFTWRPWELKSCEELLDAGSAA